VREQVVVDPSTAYLAPGSGSRGSRSRFPLTVGRVPLVVILPPPPPIDDRPWWARAAAALADDIGTAVDAVRG
jgi:hypothetical protein